MPLPHSTPQDSPEARNAEAKVWMKRGIALLSADTPAALPEALDCFHHALAIRRELPYESSSFYRWLLTACWMNRSLALRSQSTPDSRHQALLSLDHAQRVLEAGVTPERPMNNSMLATLLVNRAALLLEVAPPRMLESMQAVEEVLSLCRPTEHHLLQAAEMGLKARHIFCRAVAMLLETPPVDTTRADDWIHQATDKVDEAMRLTAAWEKPGMPGQFHALRHELFRFGCSLLLAYQPHFMAEFLLDVLDPGQGSPLLAQDKALYQAGLEALTLAAEELRRRGPLDLGLQGMDRLITVLESLSHAAQRIKKRADQTWPG